MSAKVGNKTAEYLNKGKYSTKKHHFYLYAAKQ